MNTRKQNLLDRFYSMRFISYGTYEVAFRVNGILRKGITHDSQLYDKVKDGISNLTIRDLEYLRDIAKK